MRTLGIIPARGGSKGVPRKNIAPLAGRPLLAWTAEAALAARRLDAVVLSTDDAEIAAVGERWGLEAPFLRPSELSQDDTPTLPVMQHAVAECERLSGRFDAVCLLQPTSPLRKTATIDAAIELLESSGADSVVTVLRIPDEFNPCWAFFAQGDGTLRLATGGAVPIPRRQELPPAFHREGSVYVVRRDVLMEGGSLYGERTIGLPLDRESSVNIDAPEDLERAEALLRAQEPIESVAPAAR